MLNCFSEQSSSIPITVITPQEFPEWEKQQPEKTRNWLASTQFNAEAGSYRWLADNQGKLSQVIFSVKDKKDFWLIGVLPYLLPVGDYHFESGEVDIVNYALGWGLGSYQFTRYKKPLRAPAKLVIDKEIMKDVSILLEGIYLIRDLINTPADDMGPSELAQVAEHLAKKHHANFKQIVGEELLKENYASIYTVGRASDDTPRLLDIHWGNAHHPKVVLVGKGVCFDTGGLDIKSSPYMLLMKKDMGGAAHVLGLAQMIMQANLPIRLRVLIPAVENAISGNAYRPGDIITSRKGLTVEIGNTDAEGRLVLADALTEAASEYPDLIIDISTLTGAARVAVGTDLAAMFSNNENVSNALMKQGEKDLDYLWPLPLFAMYREFLNSNIADINNHSTEPYAGAITAALFLKEFVPDDIAWVHFDIMAWNLRPKPGKPQGGEAMAVRALFHYLQKRFKP